MPTQLEAMFREVHRLLKPDGYAVLHTLPNRWVYNITFPLLSPTTSQFPHPLLPAPTGRPSSVATTASVFVAPASTPIT